MHLKVKRKKNIAEAYDIVKILFLSLIPILEASTGDTSTGTIRERKGQWIKQSLLLLVEKKAHENVGV